MNQNPAMPQPQQCCDDFRRASDVSRRRFLGGMAATGVAATTTSLFGQAVRQASFGATTGGNVLVVISFRGGIDGLGMVVPHGDPAYYAARPRIAVQAESLIAKDAMFGLHPRMEPLRWLWDNQELAAVQAVGMEAPNRSHFASMELIEDADPGSSLRQGWVNRMVGLNAGGTAVDAVHMGGSTPPTLVEGPAPTVATTGLRDITLSGSDGGWNSRRRSHLNTMWAGSDTPLAAAAQSALGTVRALAPIGKANYTPDATYPRAWPGTDLSDALKDSAKLIKSDIGTEVVSIDFGTWDMHADYGTLASGDMQNMTGAFAECLSAFMHDLGPELRSKVTVVTISEFGRRVRENGNRGLDHGWGNMMLVLGGGVKGGQYHGVWPGLGTVSEVEGDLKVTTDYRQVLGEIVHKRFPAKDVTKVFPGISYLPIGVLR